MSHPPGSTCDSLSPPRFLQPSTKKDYEECVCACVRSDGGRRRACSCGFASRFYIQSHILSNIHSLSSVPSLACFFANCPLIPAHPMEWIHPPTHPSGHCTIHYLSLPPLSSSAKHMCRHTSAHVVCVCVYVYTLVCESAPLSTQVVSLVSSGRVHICNGSQPVHDSNTRGPKRLCSFHGIVGGAVVSSMRPRAHLSQSHHDGLRSGEEKLDHYNTPSSLNI